MRDLNPQPKRYERSALTIELIPPVVFLYCYKFGAILPFIEILLVFNFLFIKLKIQFLPVLI